MIVGKLKISWDNMDERKSLRDLLRPSLIALTICGCHKYEVGCARTRSAQTKTYRMFEIAYRILFFFMSLIAFAKACVVYAYISPAFRYFNTVNTGWHLQNLMMFLVSLKASHAKYGGQMKAFDFWDNKISGELISLGVGFPEERFRKRQRTVWCVAVILAAFNIAGTTFLIVDTFETDFGMVFSAPFSDWAAMKIVSCCILAQQTLVWLFTIWYMVIVSTLLTMTFKELNKFLRNLMTDDHFNMACEFRRIRLLHLNLSKMVSNLDKDFSCYFATLFFFGICLECFILYQIVRAQLSVWNLVMCLFWLGSTLILLGIISVSAAIMNETAHGSLDSLYYVCTKDISSAQLGQLNLFLSKLTGTQIGFTTLGLLTITKEFLLTIAGVFLTYFFLLYTL